MTPAEALEPTHLEPSVDPRIAATAQLAPPPHDEQRFARGALVGRYVILERLGAGAMGVVYGAFDPDLDRKVALKFLKSGAGDLAARARLAREAQAMARLAHPNVVTVHDVGTFGDAVFVAMEFVQGVTLRHWLRERPRDWRDVVAALVAAGRGLSAAHEARLVHRDFKPENVMIGADERVRVMDFGLARSSGGEGGERLPASGSHERALALELTLTGSLVGTPPYMAPEQWEGHEPDARCDQFSFCVTLWESLYGERPFRGPTLAALMQAILDGTPNPPSHPGRAPGWLRSALERGMLVDPRSRWPSMAALLAELVRDRRAPVRRWTTGVAGGLALVASGLGVAQIVDQRAAAAAEHQRAELAAQEAATAREQAERAAFERAAVEDAGRTAEVLRLAVTPGGERDALSLAVRLLAPYGAALDDAPAIVFEGLSQALPALIPTATLPTDGPGALTFSPDGAWLATSGKRLELWSTDSGELLRTFDAGDGPVVVHAFSPDGRAMVTGKQGAGRPTCDVWDPRTGARLFGVDACASPQFSAGGEQLFGKVPPPGGLPPGPMGGYGPQYVALAAWDAATGAPRWSVPIPGENFDVLVHPDGQRLIVKYDHRSQERVDIFSAGDGRRLARLPALSGAPKYSLRSVGFMYENGLALSRSGSLLASADSSDLRRVLLWDLDAGSVRGLGTWQGHFPAVAFAPNDAQVVVSAGSTQVFDVARGALAAAGAGDDEAGFVAGDLFLTLGDDNALGLWDAPVGRMLRRTSAGGPIRAWALGARGTILATAGPKEARIWHLGDPLIEDRWTPPDGQQIVGFHGDDVTTRDRHGRLRLYRAGATRPSAELPEPDAKDGAVVEWSHLWSARTGTWSMSIITRDGTFLGRPARFLDGATGTVTIDWPDPEGGYRGPYPEVAHDEPVVAVLAEPALLRLLDARSGSARECELRGRDGDRQFADRLALSRDGARLAYLRASGEATIVDVDTCAATVTIPAITPEAAALDDGAQRDGSFRYLRTFEFAADGSLTVSHRGRTVVINPVTGAVWAEIEHPCADAYPWGDATLSPDGEHLLTACPRDEDARLWHVDSGALVARLGLPDGQQPVFSRAGDRLGYVDDDGDFIVLRTSDGAEVVRLRSRVGFHEHQNEFSDDGEHVRFLGRDGAIYTYPATRAGLAAAACRALARTDIARDVADACAQ